MNRAPVSRLDLFFVYAAYALRYLYLLVLIPFYGRVLGVEAYGQVLAGMSLMSMVWMFVSYGFPGVGGREMALAPPAGYGVIFWRQWSGRAVFSLLALVGGGVAVWASPVLAATPWLGLWAVLLGLVSAYNIGWYFTGSHRPRQSVKLEVLGFVLNLVLILSLVRSEADVNWTLGSILISGSIALAVAHWWVRGEIGKPRVSIGQGLQLIKGSSTFFVYSASSALLVSSSTYLLSLLSTSQEVGHFGAAERLASVGLAVMGPAAQVFVPRITALFAQDHAAAYRLVRKAALLLLAVGFSGCVLASVLAPWGIPLIFGAGFESSVPVLRLLAILFPLNACIQILGMYVLVPLYKESALMRCALAGAAVNILLALFLGSHSGAMGMAVARVLGECITAGLLIGLAWREGILNSIFRLK
ncbi:hypothetical protein GCM10027046_16770 [Uliginosibacterium flavum]|uniref:Oligosaccharide flippase family protein n=1 Tax=Uliginosibacterium flavum TaxID=1396831 RepID=A0ABV2TPN3_9RHOO